MKNKGITLLALIITIIILLILAAVTLNLTIGENGVFTKAKYAKEQYEKAQEKEQKQLNNLYSEMKIATNGEITVNVEDLKEIIQQEVKEELAKENQSKNPTGTIISYMGNTAPEGYLFCDGGIHNISEYSELAEQIKNQFGSYSYFGGDGETTFALPDLRGEFLRGTGTGARNTGTGNAVGSHQNATSHAYIGVQILNSSDYWVGGFGNTSGSHGTGRNEDKSYGSATRICLF